MTRTALRKRQARKGFSLQEEAPPEEPMAYDEEDDLSDLLGEEEPEEPMAAPMEDEESGLALAQELDHLYKQLDDRDEMTVQLAKAVRTLAKRVIALEGDDDDETEDKDKEDKADRKVELEAPEADMPVGGTQDLGADVQAGGEAQEPGLTAGQPQGIAQKAKIANALHAANVHMDVITKATGLVLKDDKWSNFGDKDADIPANAPVTPDTKDWDEDFEIVPGSGNAPDNVKGIGSVHKALVALGIDADKVFEGAGIIRKAQAPTVGAGATGEAQTIDDLEEQARGRSFSELNQMRIAMGDL